MLKPGIVIMVEPSPITPDGLLDMLLGQRFIITDTEPKVVDDFPLEIAVAVG